MGKRYKNTMMGKRDVITYKVYKDGAYVTQYVGDRNAAQEHAASIDEEGGVSEIRKSRHMVDK
jgi:hypothetical protein